MRPFFVIHLLLFFSLSSLWGLEKVVEPALAKKHLGRFYTIPFRVEVRQRPTLEAAPFWTLPCGTSVEVYEVLEGDKAYWYEIFQGKKSGYVAQEKLSSKRPSCFKDRYPHFIDKLLMDSSHHYYWGRLDSVVISGTIEAATK